ncbi:uncharacterized protein MAM_02670 [Metarhizium album ARSEF 1941]|uniref:Uncharacterized protein n=1 Tax=Metarhizium album (strain ARSEF 1941) TaxID=1081103 RepID=A0A0B2X276_METAS|nr:uncharacterized protein MAM_02670 [Metarhizium album ARSEF 1941]KHN99817.1 hypothetical protein MAM_02670 [Metarhizium album ARSEF 1941]
MLSFEALSQARSRLAAWVTVRLLALLEDDAPPEAAGHSRPVSLSPAEVMTFSSGFHMPGGFHADGIHQGLFRPPVSPASSSGYLSQSRPSVEGPTCKRKRIRADARHFDHAQHQPEEQQEGFCDDAGTNASTVLITPAGRRAAHNGRAYTLAGQLDTPASGPGESGTLGDSTYSDADYRKALGSRRSRHDHDLTDTTGHTRLFNLPTHPSQPPGWGSLAFSTIGGVVGKVWEFCKAGAFKGFYAGGGRGFEMQPGHGVVPDVSIPDPAWQHGAEGDEQHHRIPGHFPQGDACYDEEAAEDTPIPSGASTPSAPAAKRRQTAPTDELGRNWVMVKDRAGGADSRSRRTLAAHRPSPRNRNQGPSPATGRRISTPHNRRVSARAASPAPHRASAAPWNGFNMSPQAALEPARPASSASFASPRSPSPTKLASAAPSVAASPTPHTGRAQGRRRSVMSASNHASPFTHSRTHSGASTASGRGAADDLDNSPRLDAEARHLAARRQREERDTDVRIAALNKQLQDMIRQGKEALGTTIEVDGDDGGWEDY